MTSPICFQLLTALSARQREALTRYLTDAGSSVRQDVQNFYLYCCQCLAQEAPLDLEAAHASLFNQQPYQRQRMRQLGSWLYQSMCRFLLEQQCQSGLTQEALQLSAALDQLQLPKLRDRTLNRLDRQLDQQPLRDLSYLEARHSLEEQRYQYFAQGRRTAENNLQELNDSLDRYLLALKFRQACWMQSHANVFSTNYDFGLLPALLDFARTHCLYQEPAIGLYYHCYHFLQDPKRSEHFSAFETLLVEHGRQFPQEELGDLYRLAINHCIRLVNEGQLPLAEKGLRLYRAAIDQELLFQGGELSHFTYRNIVALGIQVGDFDWTERFLYDYRDRLAQRYRQASFQFNLAKLQYSRGEFAEAQTNLHQSVYRDTLLNLAARTLLAKIYFETNSEAALHSHLDSMHIYLRRKQLVGYHRRNYFNFLKYLRALLDLNPFDRSATQRLMQQIEKTQPLTEKTWLLRQLEGWN